jgi:hypothetical protein|tara:strand:- start:504 stop:608 length:105 start_codon:yes stop_codon:yes gene_type:complete
MPKRKVKASKRKTQQNKFLKQVVKGFKRVFGKGY